jgi:hypothetical protein
MRLCFDNIHYHEEITLQPIVDQPAKPDTTGDWTHLLPWAIDAALVAAKVKGKKGPLSLITVSHRLADLAKWHRLQHWPTRLGMAYFQAGSPLT